MRWMKASDPKNVYKFASDKINMDDIWILKFKGQKQTDTV